MTEKIELRIDQVIIKGISSHYDEDSKSMVTSFKIQTGARVEDVARIMNLQSQGAPLYCIIGSEQALMDLKIEAVKLGTGELVPTR